MGNDFLFVKDTAKILGRHEQTVRTLEQKGKLPSFRDYNGWRVFRLADVLELKEKMAQLKSEGPRGRIAPNKGMEGD